MRRFSCQLHPPLAWREFVARIDSLYCNYLMCSPATISSLSRYFTKKIIMLCFQPPASCHSAETSESAQCQPPQPPVWLMGKKRQKVQWFPVDNLDWANGEEQSVRKISVYIENIRIKYVHKIYLLNWQTSQNSEPRWLLKDSFLTPSVTFPIRSTLLFF